MGWLLDNNELEYAKYVYLDGAYSRSYAELSLQGLPGHVAAHTTVSGISTSGEVITGVTMYGAGVGDNLLLVQYNNAENPSICSVGGNPEPEINGCTYGFAHKKADFPRCSQALMRLVN